MSTASRKIDPLTTSRFFAALSVVLFHSARDLDIFKYLPMLTAGPTAVSYFFVLSGFVMSLGYYRPNVRFDIRKFWLARFLRIYPVYILSFVLTCLYYLDIISKIKPPKLLASVFLYQAWIPKFALSFNIAAWSLSVEVFFYLIFPFLIWLAIRLSLKNLLWLSLGFWTLSQFVHSILFIGFMPEKANWLAYSPFFHLNAFLLGIAGGIWHMAMSSEQKINQSTNRFLLITSLGVIFLALSLREFMSSFPQSFSLDTGLLAPFFLIIVLTLAADTSRLARILSHPWLVLLGEASYALYILHVPVRWFLELFLSTANITISPGLKVWIYVTLAIILSVLAFTYIESPARRWLQKNTAVLPFILLDIILIFSAIRISFFVRLGDEIVNFQWTQNFAVRVGVVIFFLCLAVFRFYTTYSMRSLAFASLSGSVILGGSMYLAWTSEWVESFPRSIILLIGLFSFGIIYFSRYLSRLIGTWFPKKSSRQSNLL